MRLLLVEDDRALALAVSDHLRQNGYGVDLAGKGEDAALLLATSQYAAMILDRGLPDGDGLDLLRGLRRQGHNVPVIMLTARSEIASRIAGLDAGADDYLAKPFSPDELVARLRAILRRNGTFLGPVAHFANMAFDLDALSLQVDGVLVNLSAREASLLALLLRRSGQVLTRRLAEDQLFGGDGLGSNAIEVYVHRLRHKLSAAGARVEVVTIRGVGYLLSDLSQGAA
ncbi:MAG TPA: response regulator transcription factor [Novosphingobium sp.]|nr:response regulator transcription factor [Novosphingobium sp.]